MYRHINRSWLEAFHRALLVSLSCLHSEVQQAEVETADHLLLFCVFAREREVWDWLLRRSHIWLDPPTGASPFVDWWLSSRKRLPKELRRGFDSLALLVAWSLWKERNRRVFDTAASSVNDVVTGVIAEGVLWVAASFKPLQAFVAPAASE